MGCHGRHGDGTDGGRRVGMGWLLSVISPVETDVKGERGRTLDCNDGLTLEVRRIFK